MNLEQKQRRILFFGIVALLLIVGNSMLFFFRVDLTSGRSYSISDTTRKILSGLKAPVQLTYYLSGKLKSQDPSFQQIEDLLQEYGRASSGNVQVVLVNPEGQEGNLDLPAKGISPRNLSLVDRTQKSQSLVYSGILLRYLNETKALPFINNPGSIEYELDAAIVQLDKKKNLVVGMLNAEGSQAEINTQYTIMRREFSKLYEIRELGRDEPIPPTVDVLFVFRPETMPKESMVNVDQFIMSGKGVMLAMDPVNVRLDYGLMAIPPNDSQALSMVASYGINVGKSLVMDEYSKPIPMTQSANGQQYTQMMPYPFWPSLGPQDTNQNHPIMTNVSGLDFYWVSPLSISEGVQAEVLVSSTETSKLQTGAFDVNPEAAQLTYNTSSEVAQARPLAVLRTGAMASAFASEKPVLASTEQARLIVVGDADFASDLIQYTESGSNLYFLKNLLEWLGNDVELMQIRTRQVGIPQLNAIKNVSDRNTVASIAWILNVIVIPVAVIAFGVLRAFKRRKASERKQV